MDGQAPERLRKTDLIEALAKGSKPRERWRIGSEHEKFVFFRDSLAPVPYEGEHGIGAILARMTAFGWKSKMEGGHLIALEQDGASITLEPGGQFELSGAPLETLHQTCREVNGHLEQVKAVGEEFGVGFLGVGFHPTARREEIPIMPKARYDIMRAYMPTRGTLGLDMMLRTATVQVNLDFGSEADMVEKYRISLALQPLATALFASSPLREGKPTGFLSWRSQVWTDTDPDRTGLLPFVFEDGFGFERYVDYVLDVPMYFVARDGRLHNVAGQSFRDFLEGRLPGLPGALPTLKDWEDHLTTVFPEVRLKTFLEMRGADGGPWARLCALPAFWVGLIYDPAAQAAAAALVADWSIEQIARFRADAPRLGLEAPTPDGRRCHELARDVLAIARDGLKARARRNDRGEDECHFLDTLDEMVNSRRTLADEILEAYEGPWNRDARKLFETYIY
ncbi:MAG: glutamate--cysteine ligase [Rhodothalassiaceae bacterium]